MAHVKTKPLLGASLLAMLLLSGCQREATGQVVAVVNGEEITQQEINAELGGLRLPPNVDKKVVQQRILKTIIDRRLLAKASRDDGIDKEQDYLIRQRQMNDNLLAKMLDERVERTWRIPPTSAVDKFIASRPSIFAQRTIFSVDRVQFPIPADPRKLTALKDDHTLAAVITRLNSMNIPFSQSSTQMDSAALPPAALKRVQSLPPGEPFAIPEPNGLVSVAVITGNAPAPLDIAKSRPIAINMMRKEDATNNLKQRLKNEQTAAKIEYQPGFAPSKAPLKKP